MRKRVVVFTAIIIGILGVISLLFLTAPRRLFKIHVSPRISETIKDLKHYKDRCGIQGPFIFAFSADQKDIQNIIRHNGLIKYDKPPEFIHALLIHIDSHNLSWWKKTATLESMSFYGKEGKNGYSPRLKFIFTDNTTHVYFLQI